MNDVTGSPDSPKAIPPKRIWPFHPILFAAYPVISLYSRNTALFPAEDLWRPLGILVLIGAALWAILTPIFRSIDRAALATSVAVVGFFSFGPLLDVLHDSHSRDNYDPTSTFWPWLAGYLVVVIAACWKWKARGALTKGLNAAAAVLTLIPAASIVLAWAQGHRAVPVASASSPNSNYKGPRPDIFYVILDGYGRSDALRRDMNFDNSAFIDGLKKRGFYVADSGHTNYCQTELSLTSSLNMGFLPDVVPKFKPDEQDRGILDILIDENRVSQELRGLGYKYIAITTNFPAVHPNSADLVISESRGGTLLEAAIMNRTALPSGGQAESQFDSRRENLQAAIQTVGHLGSQGSQPRFIFAHILAPHPPFVFGPNGEPIRPKHMFAIVDGSHFYQNGGNHEEYRAGYTGQAQTISRLMLAAIDDLLKREATPPIIVVQGDHGPKMRYDQELLARTDINEVFPNLNAYFVPAAVKAKLYPTITPVNSFRTILREQFGENFPNLPDRSWYSSWTWPFRLEEVTDRISPKL